MASRTRVELRGQWGPCEGRCGWSTVAGPHVTLLRPRPVLEVGVVHPLPRSAAKLDWTVRGCSIKARGGRGLIATRSSDERRLSDAPGLSGVGGVGDLKVVRLGPRTLGVWCPFGCSVRGVGGKSAGMLDLFNWVGVKCGVCGVIWRLRLRLGVGVFTSRSETGICARGGGAWIEGGVSMYFPAGPVF